MVATWMGPATESMLEMADVDAGARVLDLASGAGSQTVDAARRVGAYGHVTASDISETMLHHVRENVRAAVLADSPEPVQRSAWAEVAEALRSFEGPEGFVAPAEVLVAAAAKAA